MKIPASGYFYVFVTIVFTVAGQLLVKFGMVRAASAFTETPKLSSIIIAGFLQPAVVAGLVCAFLAAIAWFPAISRLPISVAYPFMALPIVLVLLMAPVCFRERVTVYQWLGVGVVSFGLWLAAR